jgi:hypothetical protein
MGTLYAANGTVRKQVTNEYRWLLAHRSEISTIKVTRLSLTQATEMHNVDAELAVTMNTGDVLIYYYGDFYLARHMAERFAPRLIVVDNADGTVLAELAKLLFQTTSTILASATNHGHVLADWIDRYNDGTYYTNRCIKCNRQWYVTAHTPYGQHTRFATSISGGAVTCSTKTVTAWRYEPHQT